MKSLLTDANTKYQLEIYIDHYGLSRVLGFLSEVCEEKAQHIQENYRTASGKPDQQELTWFENGALIQECSENVSDE